MKKKIISLSIICLVVLAVCGCGKKKDITCSRNYGVNFQSSSKIILYLKSGKVNKLEEHLVFQSPDAANDYNETMKLTSVKTKMDHNSVIMTYEGDDIMNKVIVNDLSKDVVQKQLEEQGYTCK